MMTHRFLALAACVVLAACARTIVVERDPRSAPPVRAPESLPTAERSSAWLRIPPGHLPREGECRIWIPDVAPGRQRTAHSRSCVGIAREAPAGSWIVYRPTRDRRLVHVRVVHERRAGVVVVVRVFDFDSRRFLREEPYDERSESDDRDEGRRGVVRPREAPAPQPAPTPNPEPEPRPAPAPAPQTPPLDIPPGHLPSPGDCRVWIPGTAAGRQPHRMSGDCERITANAPAGSWVVYTPATDRRLIYVRVVDARRDGVIVVVRVYDERRRFVREEQP